MTGDFYALMKRVMVLEETVQRLSDLYEGMKEEIEEIEPSVTYRRCKCGRMNMLPGMVVSYTADGAHSPDECKPWEFARVLQGHTGGQKKPEPPGCPACDGVAGTECRCDSRECCTDGTCESCAPLMAYWFDDGGLLHEWDDDPAPVPEWRRLVDEANHELKNDTWPSPSLLALVLGSLELIAHGYDGARLEGLLARIVAVCEGQVGGGWQADPSGWVATPNIHTLMRNLTEDPREVVFPETNWLGLGNAASAWLRDLLKEQS